MKRAVILHGTMGSPVGNWFRWLETMLKSRGYKVWLPTLPHAEQPSLSEWIEFVGNNSPFPLDEDVLIIGHSSGAILGLLLLQSGFTVGAFVGVSIFLDNSLQWDPNNRLFDVPFIWDKLTNTTTRRIIINSETDPYVPIEQAKTIAKNTNTELLVIPKQGHFNLEQSEDYKQFPKLIEILEERNLL